MTHEQEKIIQSWKNTHNMLCKALAGTGKTTTALQAAAKVGGESTFLTFGKDIATEIGEKIRKLNLPGVSAKTQHSLGFRILKMNDLCLNLNESFLLNLVDKCNVEYKYKRKTAKLIGVLQNLEFFNISAEKSKAKLEILDQYPELPEEEIENLFLEIEKVWPELYNYPRDIGFADMIWLPMALKRSGVGIDKIFVGNLVADEFQDFSPAKMAFIRDLLDYSRILCVGDKNQTIFQFTGAVEDGLEIGKHIFELKDDYPLTINWRSGVEICDYVAKHYIPEFKAGLKHAGEIGDFPLDTPNSVTLAYTNHETTAGFVSALQSGIDACLIGNSNGYLTKIKSAPTDRNLMLDYFEIQKNRMLTMINNTESLALANRYMEAAENWESVTILLNASSAQDKSQFATFIGKCFDRKSNFPQFSTVHKYKGMENHAVRVLMDEKLVGKFNLSYVAVTRAKDKLQIKHVENKKD